MKNDRIFRIIVILVFMLALLPVGEAPAQAQAPEPEITRDTLYVPGEVVVGFDSNLSKADMEAKASALAGSVGAMVVDQYANMALLSADPSADVLALAQQLTGQAGVAYAEPNYISWFPEEDPLGKMVQITEVTRELSDGTTATRSIEDLKAMRTIINGSVKPTYPNDEFNNWGNSAIKHDIIWPNKNASPVVCVIDSGVDDRHPDLKGRIIKGYDFVNNDKIPNDDNGHGTHVAGTIAAKVNNGIGPAGISNGKVLAVKAMSAQGWGTDYDIAEAIYYCANNSSVKVINMSLGGSDDSQAEYNALDYAINYKGKLVVAAAGNSSVSSYSYPAGWAKDVSIGHALLSVGASRMPTDWYDYDLWVDTNGDNVKDSNELYNADDCATSFSNYGDWVEIVAPGESIYSTTPVSYPFWNNFVGDSSSGYDAWNGTSMAAPHVAGAAARSWSFYPNDVNSWIHNEMIYGDYLTFAEDPNVEGTTIGYNNPGYGFIDDETIKAPFCWPSSMSRARFLNVAISMERGGFWLEVSDATTGLPLTGATVTVKHGTTNKTLASAKMTSMITSYVDLINIPVTDVAHDLYVNMKGYTAGNQYFATARVRPGRSVLFFPDFLVGVPPKTGTTVVANWWTTGDLDLFAFLPATVNSVVGNDLSERNVGQGRLWDSPYTRWHRDGGSGGDYLSVEAITMVNYPRSQYPFYLEAYPNSSYEFFLHDYNDGIDINNAYPIIRVWNNGKLMPVLQRTEIGGTIYYYYYPNVSEFVECDSGETWMRVLEITRDGNSGMYSALNNTCGTGSTGAGGVWPYAEGTSVSHVNGK